MKTHKLAAAISALVLLAMPFVAANANSTASNSLQANVAQSNANTIVINSITQVRNNGIADGTFENGWMWVFDVSVPINEQNLAMKFDNWLSTNMQNSIIPVANNVRFYSNQSSNSFNQNTATYINAPNTYSNYIFLTGNLGAPAGFRRVQISVEMRIPNGTAQGAYTTNFGIQTQ